ncbi:MAG: flagellar basal body protein, partial [Burkholderiaceae bacterium]|nr:flagellar basal body protein [Burkholderiaceae bacterium]
MSLLNVGARALQINQTAIQTAGHNIANVNTAG